MAGRLLEVVGRRGARLVCPSQVEKCGARSTGKKPRGQTLNARESAKLAGARVARYHFALRRPKMNFW